MTRPSMLQPVPAGSVERFSLGGIDPKKERAIFLELFEQSDPVHGEILPVRRGF